MKKSELLKMIVDLEKRVRDLENRKQYDPFEVIGPGRFESPIRIPSVWTVDRGCIGGAEHSYPLVWHGITPPPCSVCGKASQPTYTVTCSTTNNAEDIAERFAMEDAHDTSED